MKHIEIRLKMADRAFAHGHRIGSKLMIDNAEKQIEELYTEIDSAPGNHGLWNKISINAYRILDSHGYIDNDTPYTEDRS